MYCPKCSTEAQGTQRFCKSCGTNLQMIYDALGGGETNKGPFGIDFDSLAKSAEKFAQSWKTGWANASSAGERVGIKPKVAVAPEVKPQPLVPPRKWLGYSWQHNLRDGLISLFSGVGLGILLYYLGRAAIDAGTIADLAALPRQPIRGLEQLVSLLWLISMIPVLRGMAQIIYAAFFAESMATLSERFSPAPPGPALSPPPEYFSEDYSGAAKDYAGVANPPSSVTEHTTHFLEETEMKRPRDTK